jgi:aryl-alcohol dehydrogenase-like predicted oxidoreductase
VDAGLVHNHYCLNDTRILELLPIIQSRRIGIINGSPFASGLLTNRGPADWHPAAPEDRASFRAAAEFCRTQGVSISQLALQFASQNPDIPTTLFSSADPESVRRNVQWHEQPYDSALLAQVQKIIESVNNKQWIYD